VIREGKYKTFSMNDRFGVVMAFTFAVSHPFIILLKELHFARKYRRK
jgi:hypothetical protein